MKQVTFEISGISIGITSGNEGFLSFVGKYFSGFVADQVDAEPAIALEFDFPKGYDYKVGGNRVGNADVCLGENFGLSQVDGTFMIGQREIIGNFNFSPEQWRGRVSFRKNFFKHAANLLFFKGRDTSNHYYRAITRLVVQNLLFMKLKQQKGIEVISGGAIALDGNAYVFVGLPGSGKSTLLAAIKRNRPDAEILAENYVMVDGGKTHSFTEGKESNTDKAYPIRKIYLNAFGNRYQTEKLEPASAYAQITAVNNLTAELPQQSPFAACLLSDQDFGYLLDDQTLRDLLGKVPVERLVVDRGVHEFIQEFLKTYDK